MNQTEIDDIIAEFREKVCDNISDEEAAEVVSLCVRKIEITGQKEDYMKLLLPDELKNYVIRRAINATTFLRQMEKEGLICVKCVEATHA